MPDISIKIKNAAQIKSAFNKAPSLMVTHLNVAIRKSVLQISRDSIINTPVDTGRLRSSTYTKFTVLSGEVGTNTDYDIYVHDGTKFMKARPYLADAVEQDQSTVDRFFEEAVQTVLDRIGAAT